MKTNNLSTQERFELVNGILAFAWLRILESQNRGLFHKQDCDDVYGSVLEQLFLAALRYDPSRGFKFSTYAGWYIKCGILKFLFNKIPLGFRNPVKEKRKTRKELPRTFSIERDGWRITERGVPLSELICDYREKPIAEIADELNDMLRRLSGIERKVITSRRLDGMSLASVGKILHISKERVRQIEENAFRKLKEVGEKSRIN